MGTGKIGSGMGIRGCVLGGGLSPPPRRERAGRRDDDDDDGSRFGKRIKVRRVFLSWRAECALEKMGFVVIVIAGVVVGGGKSGARGGRGGGGAPFVFRRRRSTDDGETIKATTTGDVHVALVTNRDLIDEQYE